MRERLTLRLRVLVQRDHGCRVDGLGRHFTQPPAPAHAVARLPYQFTMNGPNGYFTPSNIVRSRDGHFYSMFRAQPRDAQQLGRCLMRTRDLSDPTSWRGPSSTSRNFETVGQTAQLFYTWYHLSGCSGTLDRDLIRIPIRFTGGPG